MTSIALDNISKDYLISPKLRDIVTEELLEWRKSLINFTSLE